ncbi:MAG: helix-turn-helix domain-containing protein [Eubacteriales bacterium]|nr:helix-turn-helix domain-containing protein [Eubacteriales bacterium]
MFIHRNTVHYKIRKVEEILDCDLQSTETKLYLLIATMNYQLRPMP